jgi:hypothetical protein
VFIGVRSSVRNGRKADGQFGTFKPDKFPLNKSCMVMRAVLPCLRLGALLAFGGATF